jgi:UMF1 family MFS transporter
LSKTAILNSKVIGWALYDWANSAFALSVLAVLFPLVLGNYWSVGDDGAAVTARLGWITFAASALVCLTAPLFGTIADAGGYRKRFLFVLAVIGATMTAALGLVGQGDWPLALGVYLVASFGYYSSTVFYDSLLIDVCEPRYFSFVSSLGFSLGYLGGAALLALHLWMLSAPETFGFANTAEVFSFAFISVGAWWVIFLVPLLYFVPEHHSPNEVRSGAIRAAYAELKAVAQKVGQYRNVVVFLTGYWLYIGGVFTVIFMAVNYGQRLGFDDRDLVMALLITNFVGFPATLLYGFVAHRFGPGRCAGAESLLVRVADSTRTAGRVLRLLQYGHETRPCTGPGVGRGSGDAVRRSKVGPSYADAILPGRWLSADYCTNAARSSGYPIAFTACLSRASAGSSAAPYRAS